MRVRRFGAVVVMAMGMGLLASPSGAGEAESIPPLVTTLQNVLDGVGDVLDTLTSNQSDDPAADVTQASLEYAPGWIRMKVQLKQPVNPLKDARWSDQNYLEWAFDTTGDGIVDYTLEFATEEGELYGALFDVSKPDDSSVCEADSASFSPDDGYTLVIDPKCLGNPKILGYSVEMFLDTNPQDEQAPILTDRVPDQGLRPVTAPAEPGQPAPAAPIAPAAAPSSPPDPQPSTAGGPSAARGGSTSTTASPPTTRKPPAAPLPSNGGPGPVAAPAPAGHGGRGGPSPSVAPPPVAGEPTGLPRTGSPTEQNALLGLGLLLLGVGMLVMTRPNRPGYQPA